MNTLKTPLLSVRDLTVAFDTPDGSINAVKNVSFSLAHGRTLAIVGESGSGKSTLAAAINGLLAQNGRINSGTIDFKGVDLASVTPNAMRKIRGAEIGLVPQDPMTNLNPLQRVGVQIAEALEVHKMAQGRAALEQAVALLEMAGIPEPTRRAQQYPHELSGGMRQRVLIAMGLACQPSLLIADEPTSALDVTVQRVILDELERLTKTLGTATILITHDLALAAERADEVLVMFRGDPVEAGPAAQVLANPKAEYTKRLIGAAPTLKTKILVAPLPKVEPGGKRRPLVEMVKVRKSYSIRKGILQKPSDFVAVANTNLTINKGETVAIVGGSGSGKSTTARLLLKIEDASSGDIVFDGKEITKLTRKELFAFRRRVQPVFQNPFGSLDARFTIRESISEPMILHRINDPKARARKVDSLLDQVALPRSLADRRPAEISGGQSQRVAIARALALEPDLIVLDEAVSALDVIVQEQILKLLAQLQQDLGVSYLFISHDLAVVRMLAHHVHVMNQGEIVESGTPDDIFDRPAHSYTRALIDAIPRVAPELPA